MKFTKMIEENQVLHKEIRTMEEKAKNDTDKYYEELRKLKTLDEKRLYREESEFIKKQASVYGEITNKKIKVKLMENNTRITIFNEVMPIALEVLKKYIGKPYGEKTQKKIREEIIEKTSCAVSIYNESFHIYPVNMFGKTYDIECGCKHVDGEKKSILINNKIQEISMEDLEIYYMKREYVENLDEAIENLKALKKEAKKKQEELMEICSNFNELVVDGIEHLSYTKWIYDGFNL